ncbi:hypothetical protein SB881_000951 [Campylobacter upsaliensis]|nr:hypothetical protein [Campylobacter upsaliensis]
MLKFGAGAFATITPVTPNNLKVRGRLYLLGNYIRNTHQPLLMHYKDENKNNAENIIFLIILNPPIKNNNDIVYQNYKININYQK